MNHQRDCNITLPSIKFLLSSLENDRSVVPTQLPPPQVDRGAIAPPVSTAVTPPNGNSVAKRCECNCKSHARYIPRPKNAFILFRQHLHQSLFPKDKAVLDSLGSFKTNSQVSREIGKRWRALSPEEKKYWQDLASSEKALHRQKYPDYKYIPRKVKGSRVAVARVAARSCMGTCQFCSEQQHSH